MSRSRFDEAKERVVLEPRQVELDEANAFVDQVHRHHKPVAGHRFSLGASHEGRLVGVAICGRPVARKTDPKQVLEITRLATDGTRNACSFLYSRCARIARDLGYRRVQTFTLGEENGASLRAAGFRDDGLTDSKPGLWHSRAERRKDQPEHTKRRWVIDFAPLEPYTPRGAATEADEPQPQLGLFG